MDKNLFDRPAARQPDEIVNELLHHKNVRIEKIVSDGHTTGWYDQDEDEWVCLLTGEAELEFENETVSLCAGEWLLIERHKRHRVTRTTQCVWLCVFIGE